MSDGIDRFCAFHGRNCLNQTFGKMICANCTANFAEIGNSTDKHRCKPSAVYGFGHVYSNQNSYPCFFQTDY